MSGGGENEINWNVVALMCNQDSRNFSPRSNVNNFLNWFRKMHFHSTMHRVFFFFTFSTSPLFRKCMVHTLNPYFFALPSFPSFFLSFSLRLFILRRCCYDSSLTWFWHEQFFNEKQFRQRKKMRKLVERTIRARIKVEQKNQIIASSKNEKQLFLGWKDRLMVKYLFQF